MMLDKFRQALGLDPVNPDWIVREDMPLTAYLIEQLFDELPDELAIVEEEEAKWDKE